MSDLGPFQHFDALCVGAQLGVVDDVEEADALGRNFGLEAHDASSKPKSLA